MKDIYFVGRDDEEAKKVMAFTIYSRTDERLGYVKINGNQGEISWYEIINWWGGLHLELMDVETFTLYQNVDEDTDDNELLKEIVEVLDLADDYMYL